MEKAKALTHLLQVCTRQLSLMNYKSQSFVLCCVNINLAETNDIESYLTTFEHLMKAYEVNQA